MSDIVLGTTTTRCFTSYHKAAGGGEGRERGVCSHLFTAWTPSHCTEGCMFVMWLLSFVLLTVAACCALPHFLISKEYLRAPTMVLHLSSLPSLTSPVLAPLLESKQGQLWSEWVGKAPQSCCFPSLFRGHFNPLISVFHVGKQRGQKYIYQARDSSVNWYIVFQTLRTSQGASWYYINISVPKGLMI